MLERLGAELSVNGTGAAAEAEALAQGRVALATVPLWEWEIVSQSTKARMHAYLRAKLENAC